MSHCWSQAGQSRKSMRCLGFVSATGKDKHKWIFTSFSAICFNQAEMMLSLYPTNKWAWRLKYPFISSKFLLLLFLVHTSVFGLLWIFLTSLLSSTEELLFNLIMGWIAGPIAPSSLQGNWEKAQITQFADEELIPTENWFSIILCICKRKTKEAGWGSDCTQQSWYTTKHQTCLQRADLWAGQDPWTY